jgi:hypothetical protein
VECASACGSATIPPRQATRPGLAFPLSAFRFQLFLLPSFKIQNSPSPQTERLLKLNEIAITQMHTLLSANNVKRLK